MEKKNERPKIEFNYLILYKEDIIWLYNLLGKYYSDITIEIGSYMLASTEELDLKELSGIKFNEISFKSKEYGILFSFSNYSASFYLYNLSDEQKDLIYYKIKSLVEDRPKSLLRYYNMKSIILFYVLALVGSLIYVKITSGTGDDFHNIVLVLFIVGLILILMEWKFVKNYNLSIYTCHRSENPGFLKRNKDQLLIGIIGAVVGSVITFILCNSFS